MTTTPPTFCAREITIGYGKVPVIRDLSLDIPRGGIVSIIGPNGCGKSTLLKALGRILSPTSGEILLDGMPLTRRTTREIATRLALLPQNPIAPEDLTVGDLVSRGRSPHQRWYRQWSAEDEQAVNEALARTGLSEMAGDYVDALSGGQRQRVWFAMALAQQTDIVLLDEPTTYLDLAFQVDVLDLVRRLNRDFGKTIVMVLHDLSLAAKYSDTLVAMKSGQIVAQGPARTIISEQLLVDVFDLDARVIPDPHDGSPLIIPIGRHAAAV